MIYPHQVLWFAVFAIYRVHGSVVREESIDSRAPHGRIEGDSLFWRASKGERTNFLFGTQHQALHQYAEHFAERIQQRLEEDAVKIQNYYIENDLGWPLFDN